MIDHSHFYKLSKSCTVETRETFVENKHDGCDHVAQLIIRTDGKITGWYEMSIERIDFNVAIQQIVKNYAWNDLPAVVDDTEWDRLILNLK